MSGSHPSERTPLLASSVSRAVPAEETAINISGNVRSPLEDSELHPSFAQPKLRPRWGWLRYGTLLLLCAACISILMFGFLVPPAVETYAREATQFKLASATIKELTPHGTDVHVQGEIRIDADRVGNRFVRLLGRVATSIAKKMSVQDGTLYVHLPDYDGVLLGSATIPAIVVDIRNRHKTPFDVTTSLTAGSLEGAGRLAEDLLNNRLSAITFEGRARLKLRSGILPLGRQLLTQTVTIDNAPVIPKYDIKDLRLGETELPGGKKIVSVELSATVRNPYEVKVDVPLLAFAVLIPGCDEGLINIGTANTSSVSIEPSKDVKVRVTGLVPELPKEAVSLCPGTSRSPVDHFLESYLHGNASKVLVSGLGRELNPDAPQWLADFLKTVHIPLAVPGHPIDNLIQSFTLDHVKVKLPSPDAKPGTPDASPKLSAVVEATIKLPEEMDFPVSVTRTRADADLSYLGDKFGELSMQDWVPAQSRKNKDGMLDVEAEINQVPLTVTNYEVFEKVVQKLLWGRGSGLTLGIDGTSDVEMCSSLGSFAITGIPAHGNVTIKGFPDLTTFRPKAKAIIVTDTTVSSISMTVSLIVDNPTSYGAEIPYANIFIASNGYILGNASVVNTSIVTGQNAIEVRAIYDPLHHGGKAAVKAGEYLLSEYVSGHNTTITLQPHEHSLPSLPDLSKALSKMTFAVPTPKLYNPPEKPRDPSNPDNPGDDGEIHFVESAIMHIFSSTAEFILQNPLTKSIMISSFAGQALYNGSQLGTINYTFPFAIKSRQEGKTITPRIPVRWSLGSAAYEAMVDAIGGQLKIQATAKCRVAIGEMAMWLKYNSSGVEAHIRL